MAVFTDADKAEIRALFDTASAGLKAKIRSARTDQTVETIAGVLGSSKGEGLQTAMQSLVTINITNWAALKAAAGAADGSMFPETLRAAKAAWDTQDTAEYGPALVTCFAAALKSFYGETPTP